MAGIARETIRRHGNTAPQPSDPIGGVMLANPWADAAPMD